MESYLLDTKKKTIHLDGCGKLSTFHSRVFLGFHSSSENAIHEGEKLSREVKICVECIGRENNRETNPS